MKPELVRFLNKIPDVNHNATFELSGPKLEQQHAYIVKRFPKLKESDVIGLAILNQHTNLDLFTDPEVLSLVELPLHLLDSIIFTKSNINLFNFDEPIYDTGSSRIFNFINLEDTNNTFIKYKAASFTKYNLNSLRELIINLDQLGGSIG